MTSRKPSIRATAGVSLLAIACLSAGCIARSPSPLPELEAQPAPKPSILRVRLLFGPEADLDLWVTDPGQETVYFGNNPSRSGGALERDIRCEDPAPRIEVVTFRSPEPGRYRVGIEFAEGCRRVRDPVPYEVEVLHGDMSQRVSGEIIPGRFENVALEFSIDE